METPTIKQHPLWHLHLPWLVSILPFYMIASHSLQYEGILSTDKFWLHLSNSCASEHPGALSLDVYAAQLWIWVYLTILSCSIAWTHEIFPVLYPLFSSSLRQWNFPLERESIALGGEKKISFCSPSSVHSNTKLRSSSRDNVRLAGSQFDRRRSVQRKIG